MSTTEPDDEYELEAVDPEILEHQRQRVERHVRRSEAQAAKQEIYEQDHHEAEPISFEDFGPLRFTTRHLLIATAVLAIAMALYKSMGGSLFFVIWIVGLAVAWWIVLQRERRETQKKEQRRRELEARIAAGEEGTTVVPSRKTIEADQELERLLDERPGLSFNFSIKEMLIVTAIAAVMLTAVNVLGPDLSALALGLVAGLGLVLHLMGADPPPIIVFGWWVLLVLYVVMSLLAILFSWG